jgi:dTDP-glucose pyrophosphorylase
MKNVTKFSFLESGTAREALKKINELAIPNISLFITNENMQLLGSLTDGDIRRGLLNGYSIDTPVAQFMNPNSKSFEENENSFNKIDTYKKLGIRFVPVVNKLKELVHIIDLDSLRSIIPADAVLMAGGKGERLKPLTNSTPKPLLKVGDKAIILRNIERMMNYGIKQFHISVRHMAEQIETTITNQELNNTTIEFIKEEKPLGTIGAVKLVKHFEHDTILLMNSDLLTNIDFHDFYKKFIESESDMQVATIPYHIDVPYAIMDINEKNEVLSFSEKPRFTYYSNAGIYLFKKELIHLIPSDEAFDATHFMESVIASGKKLTSYPILGYWLDIGRIDDYYKAQEDVKHINF